MIASTSFMASSRVASSAGTTAIMALCMALASLAAPPPRAGPEVLSHPNCFWNAV